MSNKIKILKEGNELIISSAEGKPVGLVIVICAFLHLGFGYVGLKSSLND